MLNDSAMAATTAELEVKNLTVSFKTGKGLVHAVRGIDLTLQKGETLAIVGESGSGKSVTAKAILGIEAPNAVIESGQIIYNGEDLLKYTEEQFHKIRGNKITMVFQDPMSSLDPIMKIGPQLTEATILNNKTDRKICKKEFRSRLKKLKAKLSKDLELNLKKSARDMADYELSREAANSFIKDIEGLKEIEKSDKKRLWRRYRKTPLKTTLPTLEKSLRDFIENGCSEKKEVLDSLDAFLKEKKEDYFKTYISSLSLSKEDTDEILYLRELYKKTQYVINEQIAFDRAIRIMDEVGIKDSKKRFFEYPFEFSGGMRQRIVIAIAIAANPDLLICDEPTTALDVTIQAQILELINRLKKERGISVIFITHDLGVVANVADRIAVMYAGRVVEVGTAEDIFYSPAHPYTWALLSSMPDLDTKGSLSAIPGTPPDMLTPPKGDAFARRSSYAMAIDFEREPPLFKISDTHYAATWLLHPNAPHVDMPEAIKERIERMKKGIAHKNGGENE